MFTTDDPVLATDLFVASTQGEAAAWFKANHSRYHAPLFVLITGYAPEPCHAAIIRPYARNRKIHFLFGNDDTGALCDLKLAAWIRNKPIKISYLENHYLVNFENKKYAFDRLSLNALEKASGYNFRIRTHKTNQLP
ncbi:hypothetical protein FO440_14415 [Mucilaginibacter corticis]|uniref:Uncharacterized protein n=1 Tax=Mucilaginibacter corticis TaxID=2597670 RepID=A0A556MLW9_9SPHI|nr:hypothetical protein [Mucilaginibacter corticis]TSJ40927.1 hypothetical protein FO440_14415 [Mucilaginibacter corticis]